MNAFITSSSCKDSGQVGLGSPRWPFLAHVRSHTEVWRCRASTEGIGIGTTVLPTLMLAFPSILLWSPE